MKEIREILGIESDLIEEKEKNKNIIGKLHFPFAIGDKENLNKRTYPSEILKREVAKLNKKIETSKIAGQVQHPEDGSTEVDKISHFIENLYWDKKEKTAFATASILNTSAGRDFLTVINSGLKLGVSMRGFGNVSDGVIQDDYNLSSIDIVSSPSFGDDVKIDQSNIFESANSYFERVEQEKKHKQFYFYKEAQTAGYTKSFKQYLEEFGRDK